MDKSDYSSSRESNSNSRDQYLNQLNKLSHKIKKPSLESHQNQNNTFHHPPQPQPRPRPPQLYQPMQHPQQPPVYNINKKDFREVVQKLTGSPAHDRISNPPPPPPVHAPKPPSSRLQRIRPPPLAQISNHHPPPFPTMVNTATQVTTRPVAPMSPLPPLPAVHAAAESPVSAYMRYLKSAIDSNPREFSGFSPLAPLVSPRWNESSQQVQQQPQGVTPQQQQQQGIQTQFQQLQPSPLTFGCLNSPLISPSLLFSPSTGFPQLPLSPTVPSPKWS